MQNLVEFYKKYFSCHKKVAFWVWGLRTSLGPIGTKILNKAISAEPCIQYLKTSLHFYAEFLAG